MFDPPKQKKKTKKQNIPKGKIIVNPPSDLVRLHFTFPLEITSVRALLPTSVKSKGKYIILLSFYISLLSK